MNICLLTDGITPYVTGGMQRHSFNLCNELLKLGNTVTLVHCVYGKTSLPKKEEVRSLFENTEKLTVYSLRFPASSGMPGHYIKESYQYSFAISELLKDKFKSFDIIYVKGFSGWDLLQQRKKDKIKTGPILVNFHGLEMFQSPASFGERLKSYLLKSPVKWNLNQADYCISYGGKITSLLNRIGIPQSKILVIPGAVSDNTLLDKRKLPVNSKFLFVGRYERRKGIEELMQVVASMPELEISFVGSIPPSKKINRANIHYYGEVKEVNALNKILDEHTFIIAPSHSEGMPNVLLEGMSRGLIPIATRVGAVEELIDNTNGFLIEPKSVDAISKSIQAALELGQDEVLQLSTQSIHKIKSKFTWSLITAETIDIFQRVLEKS
jgi:glycosyltransferase involved in cell wall biosynthesis